MKPSEVLSAAADLISPPGAWIREEWFGVQADPYTGQPDNADCWCAEGAICRASAMDYSGEVSDTDAARFLCQALGLGPFGIPAWNDAEDRTQAEVVAALRAASELAASEGQ